jgi:PAS domain S-box-containing protein
MSTGPCIPPQSAQESLPSLYPEWWRSLFEQSDEAQWICDRAGKVEQANQKAARLLSGCGLDGSANDALEKLFTLATWERLKSFLREETAEVFAGVPVICSGHTSFIADVQIIPLAGGFCLVSLRDASKRWRLESHAQRLITAVDATPDLVYLTDAEFRTMFVNAAFQTATGYTIEEVLGRPAEFLRAPGQMETIRAYEAAVSKGSDWQGELVNLRSDGSTYTVEASISPIYDPQNQLLGYVALERDTTQKKKLQEDLRLERNFALSIINSLEAAVYAVDREFCLTHVNEHWRNMPNQAGWLSFHDPPQIGESILHCVADDCRRAELRLLLETVLSTGAPQHLARTTPAGHHWVATMAPWYHEGSILGVIYLVSDHTRFHELEKQLYQAQKMETIGALAAGVAHDFNNLLTVIRGNVSLLLSLPARPEFLRQALGQIDKATTQASHMTQQLLSFSRAPDDLETVVDFNKVLQDSIELAQRSFLSRVILRVQPGPNPLHVRIQPTRAQQVLLNLCVNAQDAMPDGGQVTFSTASVRLTSDQASRTSHPPGSEFARCSVADTGAGIPPELLPKIFNAFVTTKPAGKGTGLGLSIVQSIVSQAGGFIEVESRVGTGTVFHVYFPIADGALDEDSTVDRSSLRKGSGRILVVDDLELVLDFLGRFIQAAGYEVLRARSTKEALAILEEPGEHVDLLITDYNMPGATGEQLLKHVSNRWPHIKLILTSGFIEADKRSKIERMYPVRFLKKPFQIEEASELIADLLG